MKIDLGIVIGILGILFGLGGSYFFYRKGRKVKKLIYRAETTILISEDLSSYENLKILYNNENINSLNSTTIIIRNVGNDMIEPTDFIPAMPIVVKTSNQFLLQDFSKYKITCSDRKNRVHLEKVDESNLQVIFDYLNPKDEISITILHTGDVTITGELKQRNSVKNYSNKKYGKEEADFVDNSQYDGLKIISDTHFLTEMIMMLMVLAEIFFLMYNFMVGYSVSDQTDMFLMLIILQTMSMMMIFLRRK